MSALLALLAALGLAGCTDRAADPVAVPESPQATACPDSAAIPDPALRAAIAAAVDSGGGDCATRLVRVTALVVRGRGVEGLDGIGALGGLVSADLADNRIADVAPLAPLAHLVALDLEGNRVVDASPLAGLPALEFLILSRNRVEEVGPLLAAPALRSLELTGNPLSDASRAALARLAAAGVEVAWDEPPPDGEVAPPGDPAGEPTPVRGIAFIRDQGFTGRTFDRGVYVLDPDEPSSARRLTADTINVFPTGPAWSPDGARVAFVLAGSSEPTW